MYRPGIDAFYGEKHQTDLDRSSLIHGRTTKMGLSPLPVDGFGEVGWEFLILPALKESDLPKRRSGLSLMWLGKRVVPNVIGRTASSTRFLLEA